ncbi:hypothetical protein ACOI1H_20275 [Loktanella sp. DJP18]|uniref:hypothetical protein n=1 Tax=Loktanella sp. DJP18 TaxID=3409788 RepID=UPI003BB5962B
MRATRSNIILPLLLVAGFLSGCAEDKAKHFAVGAGISAVTTHVTGSQAKGCIAALGAGLAKEAWDSTGSGHVEAADALATVAGCSVTFVF